jgi:hypothetical protein
MGCCNGFCWGFIGIIVFVLLYHQHEAYYLTAQSDSKTETLLKLPFLSLLYSQECNLFPGHCARLIKWLCSENRPRTARALMPEYFDQSLPFHLIDIIQSKQDQLMILDSLLWLDSNSPNILRHFHTYTAKLSIGALLVQNYPVVAASLCQTFEVMSTEDYNSFLKEYQERDTPTPSRIEMLRRVHQERQTLKM